MYFTLYTTFNSCQYLLNYYHPLPPMDNGLWHRQDRLKINLSHTEYPELTGDITKKISSKVRELHRIFIWSAAKWARQDSNLRPTGYEPAALPLSYEPTLPPMKSFPFHGHQIYVERETGLEPATPCLEGRNSTTELLPQN